MEEKTQEAFNRLEINTEQFHNALIELIEVVRELKTKIDEMEKNYDERVG